MTHHSVMNFASRIIALAFFCFDTHSAPGNTILVGDSEERVYSLIGKPEGTIKSGDTTYLSYVGGIITIKNGEVIDFPDDFEAAAVKRIESEKVREIQAQEQENFENEQRAKGLELYNGQWVTKEDRQAMEHKETLEAQARLIEKQQSQIDQLIRDRSESRSGAGGPPNETEIETRKRNDPVPEQWYQMGYKPPSASNRRLDEMQDRQKDLERKQRQHDQELARKQRELEWKQIDIERKQREAEQNIRQLEWERRY